MCVCVRARAFRRHHSPGAGPAHARAHTPKNHVLILADDRAGAIEKFIYIGLDAHARTHTGRRSGAISVCPFLATAYRQTYRAPIMGAALLAAFVLAKTRP